MVIEFGTTIYRFA